MIVSRKLYERQELVKGHIIGNIEAAFTMMELIDNRVAEDIQMDPASRKQYKLYTDTIKRSLAQALNSLDAFMGQITDVKPEQLSFSMVNGELVQDEEFKPIEEEPF